MKKITISVFVIVLFLLTACKVEGVKKKIVIGLSLDTLEEERWPKDRKLFITEGKRLGVEVKVQSANSDDAKQLAQAENLISQGIDVLIVVPHNSQVASSIVRKAYQERVKVISYDRLIENEYVDLYISFDSIRIGQIQANEMTQLVPKGKYVLIEGANSDHNAWMLKKGQMDILKPFIDRGDIKIVYDQWTKEWDPVYALSNIENALTANKNKIDAVIAANDGLAGGVIQGLEAQKLAGKVPVTGQDAELSAIKRIVKRKQTMTVYKPLRMMVQVAIKMAVKLAKGEMISYSKMINNGKGKIPAILLDPIVITKDNIEQTVIKDGFHLKEEIMK